MLLAMKTLPSPQAAMRIARLLFPDQPIDETTLALTLEWLDQCKGLASDNSSASAIATDIWYGRGYENGSSHTEAVEEQPRKLTTEKDEAYTEEDPKIIMKDFRAYIKKHKLPASKLSQELGVHPASIYSWLNGKNMPRDHHIVNIQKYLDRVNAQQN